MGFEEQKKAYFFYFFNMLNELFYSNFWQMKEQQFNKIS